MTTNLVVRPDGVAVITLSYAPVNSLSGDVCRSLKENTDKCLADPKVKAIVVTGEGKMFCGGADIPTLGMLTMMDPVEAKTTFGEMFYPMIDGLDGSPKTVVAALNGDALGGGFEVALGCHYRVAQSKVKCGFPEVMLGLLPGGEGTQRLPRLAPLEMCLQMIMTGKNNPAPVLNKVGVIDLVVDDDVVDIAAEFALSHPPRPVSKIQVGPGNRVKAFAGGVHMATLQAEKAARGMIAPQAIVRCLEAACTKPFAEGLKIENDEFFTLLFSKQSAAMRHLFFSERMAAKVPGLKAKPKPIKSVGIIGSGLMGGGIAMCCIQKGLKVVLIDAKQEWLDAGMEKIVGQYDAKVKKKKMTVSKMRGLLKLLQPSLDYNDLKEVDIIVEAVPEIMELKKDVFLKIEAHTKPDCYICTNTSGLNIDDIASVLKDPSRTMGTHFFSPANVMPLLENVKTAKGSPEAIATCMAFGKFINKKAILVGNCDGFVGNRMIAPYSAEFRSMVMYGADIGKCDSLASKTFGMAMGPASLGDLVGLELFWKQRKAKGDMNFESKTSMGPNELTDWLCEQGRWGLKTPDKSIGAKGRGIFIYQGREKTLDPEVVAKVAELQKSMGIKTRTFSDDEIIERLFFPLINEGFKILEEGFATRPSDVDICYIYGYGFPPAKGGPMFFAENYVGLKQLLTKLQAFEADMLERPKNGGKYRDYFKPSKLLELCVEKECTIQDGLDTWRQSSKL